MAKLSPTQRAALQSMLHGVNNLDKTAVWAELGKEGQDYLLYVFSLCKRALVTDETPAGTAWNSLIGTAPTNSDPAQTWQEDPFGE